MRAPVGSLSMTSRADQQRSRGALLGLLAIVAVAALLRFATIATQSFWLDEAVTADLMHRSFGSMLQAIWDGESSPPLYYGVAWVWTHIFAAGEAGLRSLSALIGVATVPVAAAIGIRLTGRRDTALIAAALVAVNPLLVWYGQEGRAYALLVFLASLALLLMLRAAESPSRGRLAAWGLVCALALGTHYFAIYVVAAQVAWLLWQRLPARALLVGLAPVVIAGLALAPLALHQRGNDLASFIRGESLATRTAQVPKQWLIGYDGPSESLTTALALLLVLPAVFGLVTLIRSRGRGPATGALAVAAGSVLIPLCVAVVGEDQLLTRNVLGGLVAALCLLAAGYSTHSGRGRPLALAAMGALVALWLGLVVQTAREPRYQREDWRGAVRELGAQTGPRAVVVTPGSGGRAVRHYLQGAQVLSAGGAAVREIDWIVLDRHRSPDPAPAAIPPGFSLVGTSRTKTFAIVRLRADVPVSLDAGAVAVLGDPGAVTLVER